MRTFYWVIVCFCVGLLISPGQAQDWMYYGSDQGGSKYSSLDHITAGNVDSLERAWTYRHGDLETHPERKGFAGFHATPILLPEEAGRHLVLCTPFNRIAALDPTTGTEEWSYDPEIEMGSFGTRLKCLGVAYWENPDVNEGAVCKHSIFMGTSDRRIINVDARDGTPCPNFGNTGQVDVNPIIAAAPPNGENPWGTLFSAPPVIINGIVVLGSINNMKNRFASAAGGAIRGFDAVTGELRWTFDPIPRDPQDPEHQNWTAESLKMTGGANTWTLLSVDEERDLVFVPTSSASPNFFGGTRPGDNRYANSIVALRGSTGEVVWHFQTIHHDVWDWDLPAQPMLVDLTKDGQTIPALVLLTKQGLIFTFNRETGEPVYAIEERPVPQDGVPGEVLSPTQPFPVSPPPLMKGGLTPDDAWGLTFWDEGKCREEIENAEHGPIFTPPSTKGWIMYPGTSGAMNWGGGAYDPTRNLLITPVSRVGMVLQLLPKEEVDPDAGFDPQRGAPMGPPAIIQGTDYALKQKIFLGPLMVPCTPPPWSTLVAVDLAEGKIKWEVPLGVIDKLAPIPLPAIKWGTPSQGGPIITAGGLAFIGATADSRLRAFDVETGEEVWTVDVPRSSHATPMTYEIDGTQYVVIASGGHMFVTPNDIDDYLVAYALPNAND